MILKALMQENTSLQYYFDLDQTTAKNQAPFPQALTSLESVFSDVKKYQLNTNYRMDKSIDTLARSFFYNESQSCDRKFCRSLARFSPRG